MVHNMSFGNGSSFRNGEPDRSFDIIDTSDSSLGFETVKRSADNDSLCGLFENNTFDNNDSACAIEDDGTAVYILWTVCPAILLLFGLVGNILSFIVIWRLRSYFMPYPSYFAALTLSDTIILLFTVLPRWVDTLTALNLEVEGHWMCRMNGLVYYSAFTASSWFFASIATQRAAAVTRPKRAKKMSSKKVTALVISLITILSILLSIHMLVKDDFGLDLNQCYLGSSVNMKENFSGCVLSWMNMAGQFFLPFLMILVANIVLVQHLKTPEHRVRSTAENTLRLVHHTITTFITCNPKVTMEDRSYTHKNVCQLVKSCPVTYTITLMAILFVLLVAPAHITEALVTSALVSKHSIPPAASSVFELMKFANAAVKCYLYCWAGDTFRNEVKVILKTCGRRCRKGMRKRCRNSLAKCRRKPRKTESATASITSKFSRHSQEHTAKFWSKLLASQKPKRQLVSFRCKTTLNTSQEQPAQEQPGNVSKVSNISTTSSSSRGPRSWASKISQWLPMQLILVDIERPAPKISPPRKMSERRAAEDDSFFEVSSSVIEVSEVSQSPSSTHRASGALSQDMYANHCSKEKTMTLNVVQESGSYMSFSSGLSEDLRLK